MPSNPYKEEQKCILWLDKLLNSFVEANMQTSYDQIILQARFNFAVSTRFVEKHIERFYVRRELFTLEKDVLTQKK